MTSDKLEEAFQNERDKPAETSMTESDSSFNAGTTDTAV